MTGAFPSFDSVYNNQIKEVFPLSADGYSKEHENCGLLQITRATLSDIDFETEKILKRSLLIKPSELGLP